MDGRKVKQVEQDCLAMRSPEHREVVDRIDAGAEMIGDFARVFRIAVVEHLPIPQLEHLSLRAKRR